MVERFDAFRAVAPQDWGDPALLFGGLFLLALGLWSGNGLLRRARGSATELSADRGRVG